MPTILTAKTTKARARPDKVRQNLLNTMRSYKRKLIKEFDSTVNTWEDPFDIPKFDDTLKVSLDRQGNMAIEAGPIDDGSHGYDIWKYLNGGTSVRWAYFSSDWQSKSAPGQIPSGEGAGYVTLRGRKAIEDAGLPPGEGIEARDWTGQIKEKYKKDFTRDVRAAIRKGLKG